MLKILEMRLSIALPDEENAHDEFLLLMGLWSRALTRQLKITLFPSLPFS